MAIKNIPVCVYGTLKKSGHFHDSYLGRNKFLGECHIDTDYSLFLYDWPILVEIKSGKPVKGELYETDKATLKRLDYLEGHPDYYKRRVVKVTIGSGEKVDAWVYVFERDVDVTVLEKVYDYPV